MPVTSSGKKFVGCPSCGSGNCRKSVPNKGNSLHEAIWSGIQVNLICDDCNSWCAWTSRINISMKKFNYDEALVQAESTKQAAEIMARYEENTIIINGDNYD